MDMPEMIFLHSERKYDAILIDACDSVPDENQAIVCPVSVFLKEEFIKNTAQLITRNGVAAFNVYTDTLTPDNVHELLTPRFSNYFNYCNVTSREFGNLIFYCTLGRPVKEKRIDIMNFVNDIPY
ncbi:hypothetical protein Aduo_010463 [Ancylostoma duodenale]